LVSTGSVAASWFPDVTPPIDALIIGSIDENTKSSGKHSAS
jgi:ethanolamine utilization protein EutN